MARRQARFMIGLFVTVGVLIGVTAVVWLEASKYFRKGSQYVTYFDESVQGLQVDSSVMYRGVEVGNVERIGVAPDHQLVEVIMKIALEGDVEHTIVSQLRAAGITGIVFVELDRRQPDELVFLPTIRMSPGYTVIPSKPSQATRVLSGIDRIMEVIAELDIKGISDQVKQTSRGIQSFFAGPETKSIAKNLDSTIASLDKSLKHIERIMAGGKVDAIIEGAERGIAETRQTLGDAREGIGDVRQGIAEARQGIGEVRQGIGEARQGIDEVRQGLGDMRQAIAETRQGVADLRNLLAAIEKEVGGLKSAEISTEAKRLVEGLDRRTKVTAADLRRTTADIRDAADSLLMLIERLKANPSDLLFSRPLSDDRERER